MPVVVEFALALLPLRTPDGFVLFVCHVDYSLVIFDQLRRKKYIRARYDFLVLTEVLFGFCRVAICAVISRNRWCISWRPSTVFKALSLFLSVRLISCVPIHWILPQSSCPKVRSVCNFLVTSRELYPLSDLAS